MMFRSLLLGAMLVGALCACSGGGSSESLAVEQPATPTRSFEMGFTPWLYEATSEAQDVTYARLIAHGDIIKHHLMGGIPWQEALDGTALSSRYPNLKLMTSVAMKSPGSTEMQEIATRIGSLLPYTDVLGISIYPYVFFITIIVETLQICPPIG